MEKKTLWPLFMDWVQLPQGFRATTRKQFTFLTLRPLKFLVPQESKFLCCMDTDSFIVHSKSEDIYAGLAGYVTKRYDTFK